jgi:hypothetical protein
MKIYIASSWKNESWLIKLAISLKEEGHSVDLFCESYSDRYVFDYRKLNNNPYQEMNCIAFLQQSQSKRAIYEDKKWLAWADCCVLVLPAGRSAHLEAGYAKGQGKRLYILGEFPKGEFDVMYGFADGLFSDFNGLAKELKKLAGVSKGG